MGDTDSRGVAAASVVEVTCSFTATVEESILATVSVLVSVSVCACLTVALLEGGGGRLAGGGLLGIAL